MKKIFEGWQYSVYKCEECGKEQYAHYPIKKHQKCCCIHCKNYGYDHDYTKEQYHELAA